MRWLGNPLEINSITTAANPFYRCAAHFGSPRARDNGQFIYHLLLQAEVHETDAIVKHVIHTWDNETVKVEDHQRKLHVSEDSGVLKIYVPKDRKDQELCFLQLLPTKLFNEVIMFDKSDNSARAPNWDAVRIIAAIFMSSDEVICDLLDDAGVIPLPYSDEFNIEAYDQASSTTKPRFRPSGHLQINRGTESRALRRAHGVQSSKGKFYLAGSKFVPRPTFLPPSSSSSPTRKFTPFLVDSGRAEYWQLLDNIIAMAKDKSGEFLTRGVYNFDELHSALPGSEPEQTSYNSYNSPFGIRSPKQREHDLKLGAAGELYVSSKVRTTRVFAHSFTGV
jgi:hypothetical protein